MPVAIYGEFSNPTVLIPTFLAPKYEAARYFVREQLMCINTEAWKKLVNLARWSVRYRSLLFNNAREFNEPVKTFSNVLWLMINPRDVSIKLYMVWGMEKVFGKRRDWRVERLVGINCH